MTPDRWTEADTRTLWRCAALDVLISWFVGQ